MSLGNIDTVKFFMSMVAVLICLTIHEFAHAYSAYRAGDETPKLHNRLSLNPLNHLDPLGAIMIVVSSLAGFGIGWGKPVLVNPYNFRSPRWDNLKVAIWGPLSNILTALVAGLVLRFVPMSGLSFEFMFLSIIVRISIVLAIFNMIPISPLDGSKVLSSLLPNEMARSYDRLNARTGSFLFLGLILFGGKFLGAILGPPSAFLFHLFTGMHFF